MSSEAGTSDDEGCRGGRRPGFLVLVVGASGVGKDSLIRAAKLALGDRSDFVFPRRCITRAADPHEDHVPVTPDQFAAERDRGGYALWWSAHGHEYGVLRAIEADLAAGRAVVCNVSRGVISSARQSFTRVSVIEITAPVEVRAARLAARGRETIEDQHARLRRQGPVEKQESEIVIDNGGALAQGIAAFVAQLKDIVDGGQIGRDA